eukprot:1140506-Pelagomonas_calceolata.AAC.4
MASLVHLLPKWTHSTIISPPIKAECLVAVKEETWPCKKVFSKIPSVFYIPGKGKDSSNCAINVTLSIHQVIELGRHQKQRQFRKARSRDKRHEPHPGFHSLFLFIPGGGDSWCSRPVHLLFLT